MAVSNASLKVDLAGMILPTPVLAASGPFGYGREYLGLVSMSALGAIIVKGVSLQPWTGNPPPRLVETAAGLLNAVGLQNPGLEHFLREDLPALRKALATPGEEAGATGEALLAQRKQPCEPDEKIFASGEVKCAQRDGSSIYRQAPRTLHEEFCSVRKKSNVPRVIVNIVGRTVAEYAAVAAGLEGVEGVDGIEINISCPNIKAGGLAFGVDPAATAVVVAAVREKTSLPLLVKLSPNVTDITVIARAAEDAGADALSLINTLAGMSIDLETRKPQLGNTFGGLSGPAIMPVALKMVWQAAGAVSIPLLGMGGITCAADALRFIMAGARAVAVGTGIFYDPQLPEKIVEGMCAYMKTNQIAHIGELEGVARKEVMS